MRISTSTWIDVRLTYEDIFVEINLWNEWIVQELFIHWNFLRKGIEIQNIPIKIFEYSMENVWEEL